MTFYVFFLCRALGGGDIKLMALCVGQLGVSRGIFALFCGFLLAAGAAAVRLMRSKTLWPRLFRAAEFAWRLCIRRKPEAYPGAQEEESRLHLAPYLAAGYLISLILATVQPCGNLG